MSAPRLHASTAALGSALILAALAGTSSATWAAPTPDPHWQRYSDNVQAFGPEAQHAREQAGIERAAQGHGRCVSANLAPRVADGVVVTSGALAWYMSTAQAWAAHDAGSSATVRLFCYGK